MHRTTVCLAVAMLLGCATTRPTSPPAGEVYELPWGAVAMDRPGFSGEEAMRSLISAGIRNHIETRLREGPEGRLPYKLLALSGGGSRGAYGAGVLTGWTESGTRPDFDVVTGISTGALMATFAFLGPDYDDALHLYTQINDEDIYHQPNILTGLTGVSFSDTRPLKELIARQIDPAVLDAVAREYARGRFLFIGTTNLDARAFTVWDMGAIASSGREDRLERYRDVVLASASLPVLFPPVYISTQRDGGTYWQMHVDGGVRETVFYYDFGDEIGAIATDMGLTRDDVDGEVFLLHNGDLYAEATYFPVEPGSLGIAGASLITMMRKNTVSSIYRLYVQSLRHGLDFHLTFIPPEYDLETEMHEFDQEAMTRLFEYGRSRARSGEVWDTTKATEDIEELLRLIDPADVIESIEARPEYRR